MATSIEDNINKYCKNTRTMIIGNENYSGKGAVIESISPIDGRVIGSFYEAQKSDIDKAIVVASSAYKESSWANELPHIKAKVLRKIAQSISQNKSFLAYLQMLENGKTLLECQSQVDASVAIFNYFASLCETSVSHLHPQRGDFLSMDIYEPYGVVAAITPWNSPLTMAAQKIAPALAAGNSIIFKPSEVTTLVSLAFAEACLVEDLPYGILNVVTGKAEVGKQIINNPTVKLVSFTGGTSAGKMIAKQAAERLMPVILELGGKSPNIVFEDADIDSAVAGVANGVFSGQGQSCIAGTRLFVQKSIFEEFTNKLKVVAEGLKIGSPIETDTKISPLASFEHRDKVVAMVEDGLSEAGELVTGGKVQDSGNVNLLNGAYYKPTIILVNSNKIKLCQEEIFGPVLVVLTFESENELIEKANDSLLGLACGIWTQDVKKAWRIARAVEAGTVWINTYKKLSIAAPFGGFKESGVGREKGVDGIRQYQQQKSIYLSLESGVDKWAK